MIESTNPDFLAAIIRQSPVYNPSGEDLLDGKGQSTDHKPLEFDDDALLYVSGHLFQQCDYLMKIIREKFSKNASQATNSIIFSFELPKFPNLG